MWECVDVLRVHVHMCVEVCVLYGCARAGVNVGEYVCGYTCTCVSVEVCVMYLSVCEFTSVSVSMCVCTCT